MRLKPLTISTAVLALIFAILSTVFVLLTTTSKKWAIQKYYESPNGGGSPST